MQNDSKLKSDSKNKLWCSHIGLYRIERTTDTTLYGTHIKIRYTPEMQQLFKPTSHPIGGGEGVNSGTPSEIPACRFRGLRRLPQKRN